MKSLYVTRVILFSVEIFILIFSSGCIYFLDQQANSAMQYFKGNDEFEKYFVLLPIALMVWMLKEGKDFLGSDKKLMNWPDYWKLKVHVYVSYFYAVLFLIISAVPWLTNIGLSPGVELILFITGLLGCLWTAGSIYFAQITVKEILNQEFISAQK